MPESRRRRNYTSGEASGVRLGQRLSLQTTEQIGSLVVTGAAAAVAAAEAALSVVDGATTLSTRIEKIENKSLSLLFVSIYDNASPLPCKSSLCCNRLCVAIVFAVNCVPLENTPIRIVRQ
jgi:hypothetical protein